MTAKLTPEDVAAIQKVIPFEPSTITPESLAQLKDMQRLLYVADPYWQIVGSLIAAVEEAWTENVRLREALQPVLWELRKVRKCLNENAASAVLYMLEPAIESFEAALAPPAEAKEPG